MAGIKAFQVLLQDQIRPEDNAWSYQVPNLPKAQKTNDAKLVKLISVVSSTSQQCIRLRLENAPSNRVTWSEPLDRLVLISFADFKLHQARAAPDEPPRPATARESADYVTRLLQAGVLINGIHYHFFGHSNSQLKSRSCFLYAASKEEISVKVEYMGDFSKLKSAGKKSKRIGLLFSSAEMGIQLLPERCEDIDDVKRDDYMFTDGCGLIATHLAKQLVRQRNIQHRNKRYLPSVFQIRYRGYKGVLTIDPRLSGKTLVRFRESMRKFKDAKDLSLSVVDYSKPYAFGYLNDEVVLLLHCLGISSETLLRKQAEYLQFLQAVALGNPREAFQFLSYCNRLDLAERMLMSGVEAIAPTLRSLIKQEYTRMLNKREEQRCRILIPQSRLLFGVCDPFSTSGVSGQLKEGQCFVRITHDGDGEARTITGTEVLVTRNPCLHPGDLQKFKAIDVPELAHLVDCIVFPTRGKRPSADLMSGGDLDGDKFFVTWDPDIIPEVVSQAAEYPGVKESIAFKMITDDDRAEYFARYTNASLGRVKNLYLKWARLRGSLSPECQQLNRLFSQCVDGNRIRVPPGLEDPPEPPERGEAFVLDVLHTASKRQIETVADQDVHYNDYPVDALTLLLNRNSIAISEFDLIQLTLRWCDCNKADLMDFAEFFNFSALNDEQRTWLLNRLPPSKEHAGLVRNGLLQSHLVEPSELRRFRLDHPGLHWKPVFSSLTDRMGRFLNAVCRSLELFHKKLIILRVDERLTLAIYVPNKIAKASEVQVDASVRVFALPRSQGSQSASYRVMPTKVNYRLYCDDSAFQLYELKRANTWVFLTRGPSDESSYRNITSQGDRRRQKQQTIENGINFECRASVALQKISRSIQTHVGKLNRAGVLGAEIYVISNRDVKSMQLLDQWLNYIDTQEVLPLFEQVHPDYTVPKLKDVPWSELPPCVSRVVRDKNLSTLRYLDSLSDIREILLLLSKHDEIVSLRNVYTHLLDLEASNQCAVERQDFASCLLNVLPHATYLVTPFFRSQTWKTHKHSMEGSLVQMAPALLTELVLSANSLQGFIRDPFLTLLQELKQISQQHLAELAELIALSVRAPEVALDLLLECIEPETSRLLVGRPTPMRQFTKCLIGIALDHVDEAEAKRPMDDSLELAPDGYDDGFATVKSKLRIDSRLSGILRTGDHVRLTASNPPQNAPLARPYSMDAVVLSAELGSATFRCLHQPPSYIRECAWKLTHCGPFVTSKTMFDAVTNFYTEKESCCRLYANLIGISDMDSISLHDAELPFTADESLNASQNRALEAATKHPLALLWGPPGTGKTHTVVVILKRLLDALPQKRFLVTAPTHNAVDNILQKFVQERGLAKPDVKPVRVSTNLSKVSPALREYTCDAMVGKDLAQNMSARRKAQKRIKESRLVFTTCAGAGLGLLRTERFEVVLVDEASQQTEPETLIPLVKGCERAILVGDHVQLRATVQKNAVVAGFDVSLFERHYNMPKQPGVAKVMLDTQYRMHRDICEFSSEEFYEGNLKTAVADDMRPLTPSQFPWPGHARKLFIQCSSSEDLGRQSKANQGQAQLCRRVCELLNNPPDPETRAAVESNVSGGSFKPPEFAILTPYARQRDLLKSALPKYDVSSIDGYQGREADIIVFVTVRCNVHCETGFLKDMRRLNVAMTRAKSGVIIIGDRNTLTGSGSDNADMESKRCWKKLLDHCTEVGLPD